MTNTEFALSAARAPRSIADAEPLFDLGCVGFDGACGAPAGSPCEPFCPASATDDYLDVFCF